MPSKTVSQRSPDHVSTTASPIIKQTIMGSGRPSGQMDNNITTCMDGLVAVFGVNLRSLTRLEHKCNRFHAPNQARMGKPSPS